MPRYEQQTTINSNLEDKNASIWTNQVPIIKKIEKMGIKGDKWGDGMKFSIPRGWIRFRKPREMTDSSRNEMRERAHKMIEANRNKKKA